MGILGRFFGRGSTAKPEARVIGHRGVAAGDVQGRIAAGKASRGIRVERLPKVNLAPGVNVEARAFTDDERRRHQMVGPVEVQGFVYEQQPMSFHSSNVLLAQYFAKDNKLMVEYQKRDENGKLIGQSRGYMYSNVTPREAISLAQAGSKGVWSWSNLKRAGKPFVRIK